MKNTAKIKELISGKSLNPNKEDLTVEKLKTFTGFETITDKDAQATVANIQSLAAILHEFINSPVAQPSQQAEIINIQTKQAA
ncbi:MAG: hypothetical protein IT236_09250 [Bacteroidia bacterium]|nr:hypothetical protein [Bacteroidia bacterium]